MRDALLLVQCENNETIRRVAAVKSISIDVYASDMSLIASDKQTNRACTELEL